MAGRTGQGRTSATTSAASFIPPHPTLAACREAVSACRGCELYRHATQGVLGEGPSHARIMLVGEQPGNDEDLAGRPFVGPAGRLLDRALAEAGLDRRATYVTNAVKHFKWTPRGKRRIHEKPTAREVEACRPWFQTELDLVKPDLVVALGATAAQSLLGPAVRVTKERGHVLDAPLGARVLLTVHPSSLLRITDDTERDQAMERFVADLRVAARTLEGRGR
ncbi:MAG TPA: UdgX family uracil-DNA binding protein [Methylomirabilota bacterium]|nr:UdgX family uracil-DNA binding protein [Methylomirabilota bacterium]